MSARKTVMVLFGGQSSEHQISCATAAGVLTEINREKWDVVPVGITQDGHWIPQPDRPEKYQIDGTEGYTVTASGERVALLPGEDRLTRFAVDAAGDRVPGSTVVGPRIDVVLPLLHGVFGEDGTLQGMLEICGVKYVGCGVASSAVSMDKYLTKAVLQAAGLPVGEWELVTAHEWDADRAAVSDRLQRLGLPVFVKPCRAGSSVGISRVTDISDLPAAIAEAQRHDPRVLVEAQAVGAEVECAVLEMDDGNLIASPLGEVVVQGAEFYDYQAKYFATQAVQLRVPANVPEKASDRIREAARQAFLVLEGEGLARVDFFYDAQSDQFSINEVNTMPGFTPYSMYPRLLGAAGVHYSRLIDLLLEQGLSRPMGLR